MSNCFIQGAFEFTCTSEEADLLGEIANLVADLGVDATPIDLSPALVAAFPPTDLGGPLSGLLAIFDDPDFPDFGAIFEVADDPDTPGRTMVRVSGREDFNAAPIGDVIQRCCRKTLAERPIGFEWVFTSTKLRPGEYGGGWCVIFADSITIESTRDALDRTLSATTSEAA